MQYGLLMHGYRGQASAKSGGISAGRSNLCKLVQF